MTDRQQIATQLLAALLANPERYKYIAEGVASCRLTQEEATAKNVNKAVIMADALLDALEGDDPERKVVAILEDLSLGTIASRESAAEQIHEVYRGKNRS